MPKYADNLHEHIAKDPTDCLVSGRIEIRATAEKLERINQMAQDALHYFEEMEAAQHTLNEATENYTRAYEKLQKEMQT